VIKAVIDLGTNTFKCLIADVGPAVPVVIRDYSIAVRLGEGLAQQGIITPEAELRAIDALRMMLADCAAHKAVNVLCVGAMTLRSAMNAEAFMHKVRSEFGLDIVVLDGNEEATLVWEVTSATRDCMDMENLVMDIGGGSTELIRGKKSPDAIFSLPIGALTLTSGFLHGDPPTATELSTAQEHIRYLIPTGITQGFSGRLIAGGGTVTNLASAYLRLSQYDAQKVHATVIGTQDVIALLDRFQRMTIDHLRQVPGLQPQRAAILIGGILILACVLEATKLDDFTVSAFGIRHALLNHPGQENLL
jgi:exopolyphosphatase/guanosine-5'-triphosphate,3'-diphosphate pyrophosphatase